MCRRSSVNAPPPDRTRVSYSLSIGGVFRLRPTPITQHLAGHCHRKEARRMPQARATPPLSTHYFLWPRTCQAIWVTGAKMRLPIFFTVPAASNKQAGLLQTAAPPCRVRCHHVPVSLTGGQNRQAGCHRLRLRSSLSTPTRAGAACTALGACCSIRCLGPLLNPLAMSCRICSSGACPFGRWAGDQKRSRLVDLLRRVDLIGLPLTAWCMAPGLGPQASLLQQDDAVGDIPDAAEMVRCTS